VKVRFSIPGVPMFQPLKATNIK